MPVHSSLHVAIGALRGPLALLFFFVLPASLEAKQFNFRDVKFGFGFYATRSHRPTQNFAGRVTDSSPLFSSIYGGEFSFFVASTLEISGFYAIGGFEPFSGSNVDRIDGRAFIQSGEGKLRFYGGRIRSSLLSSDDAKRRLYLGFGGGQSSLGVGLTRNYTSSPRNTYSAEANSTAVFWEAHLGASTVIVQNWKLSLEAGYLNLNFRELSYEGPRNLRGDALSSNRSLIAENGQGVSVNMSGTFATVRLGLLF